MLPSPTKAADCGCWTRVMSQGWVAYAWWTQPAAESFLRCLAPQESQFRPEASQLSLCLISTSRLDLRLGQRFVDRGNALPCRRVYQAQHLILRAQNQSQLIAQQRTIGCQRKRRIEAIAQAESLQARVEVLSQWITKKILFDAYRYIITVM